MRRDTSSGLRFPLVAYVYVPGREIAIASFCSISAFFIKCAKDWEKGRSNLNAFLWNKKIDDFFAFSQKFFKNYIAFFTEMWYNG